MGPGASPLSDGPRDPILTASEKDKTPTKRRCWDREHEDGLAQTSIQTVLFFLTASQALRILVP